MLTVLINAGRAILGWAFGNAMIKGITLTALSFVFVALAEWLWSLLPSYMSPAALTSSFMTIPPGIWWMLDLIGFDYGAPLLIGAVVIRFLIRRIPVIG